MRTKYTFFVIQKTENPVAANNLKRSRWSIRKDGKTGSPFEAFICGGRSRTGCGGNLFQTDTSMQECVSSPSSPSSPSHFSDDGSASPPDNSFTRTISDPESMMLRKRQQTLGAKLTEITSDGCEEMGAFLFYISSFYCCKPY